MGSVMNQGFKLFSALFFCMILWSCTSPNDIVDYTEDLLIKDPEPGSTAGYNEEKNVYFGDENFLIEGVIGDEKGLIGRCVFSLTRFDVLDRGLPLDGEDTDESPPHTPNS